MFPYDPVIASTIQDPDQLFRTMGTFWQQYLADADLLQVHQWAKLQLHGDIYLRTVELAAAASIQQVTPFLAQQWQLVRLLHSELTQTLNVVQYGSGVAYGDGTVYGQLRQNSYQWQLDTRLKNVGILVDNVIDPDFVFDVSNCLFNPANSTLSFTVNPFTQLPSLPVYDGAGNVIDQQILLWARNVSLDIETPWLRYGSIIKMQGTSSPDYVRILQACWSMLVNGPSIHDLVAGVMASVGLPVTQGDETVQIVQTDTDGLAVVTDKNVYRFHTGATPLVDVGDILIADQALVDTVVLQEFCAGVTHDYSAIPGFGGGPELIDGTVGMLIFPNTTGETWDYVGGDARCQLFGDPEDVADFWESVHVRGLAAGQTLAQWLGVTGSGQVAVNPVQFAIENFIASNLIVITVKPQHFLDIQSGFLPRIHDLMPAGQLVMFIFDLTADTDTYVVAGTVNSATVYPALLTATDTKTHTTDYYDTTPFITVT